MSIARDSRIEVDPYPLGWHHTGLSGPDGAPDSWRVPLTESDILHPQEGDFIVQDPDHIGDCIYLKPVLDSRLVGVPGAVVLTDVRVDLGLPGVPPVGPDIAALVGVGPSAWPTGGTLNLATAGVRPLLMIEITSPSTEEKDLDEKWRWYAEAGVPTYAIVEVRGVGEQRRLKIIGHRLAPGSDRFDPAPLDLDGRLWLGDELGVWLGISGRHLACFDGATGEQIGDYLELARRIRAAEVRLALEAEACAEAERESAGMREQIRAMQEEMRRLRGEA